MQKSTKPDTECCYFKRKACRYSSKTCNYLHSNVKNQCNFGANCRYGHFKNTSIASPTADSTTSNFSLKQMENELLEELDSKTPTSNQHLSPNLRSVFPPASAKQKPKQPFDYYLVLDLEGKEEVLEFPVLMFNSETLNVDNTFHCYVRPTKMAQSKTRSIVANKYGSMNAELETTYWSNCIKWKDVLEKFHRWLHQNIISKDKTFTFVTCGNW